MDLSINLGYLMNSGNGGGRPGFVKTEPDRSVEKALEMCCELGYKKIDYNGNGGGADIDKLRSLIDSYGISVNQSHAPCNWWAQHPTEDFIKSLMRSIEVCHKLGSKIFVVHGDQIDKKNMEYSEDAVLEYNYRVYYPVVEFSATHGMKVAFENIFDKNLKHKLYCSRTEELITLTEKFADSGSVGICWDFGHGNVMFDPNSAEEMKKTGKYLIATHVHDNYFGGDMHGIPFTGNLDWKTLMNVLKEVDYKGDFTFEFVYNNCPDELFMDLMRFARKAGDVLIGMMSK